MATNNIPKTMRAVAATKYCKPDRWEVIDRPTPSITKDDDVLVKVEAAGLNTADTIFANGGFRLITGKRLPHIPGIELSGTVVAVGEAVKEFKIGDAVIGGGFKPGQWPLPMAAFMAEYAIVSSSSMVQKPVNLSFTEAGCFPGVTITAIQGFKLGLEMMFPEVPESQRSLKGMTVLVIGGLSGTGSVACQMAKNVYGASKVITTVSTSKVPLLDGYLGTGVVDQVIDYTKQDILREIGRHNVDFIYSTRLGWTHLVPLVRKGGAILSVASIPDGQSFKKICPGLPRFVFWLLDLIQLYYLWFLWGSGVHYGTVNGDLSDKHNLKLATRLAEDGKIKAVIGYTASINDLPAIREGAMQVFTGKGGIGKFVVEMKS